MYRFRIDIKEDDVNKCIEVLPVILYLACYCCCVVFKKIKCNSLKNLISGRDNVEEILEIAFRALIEVLFNVVMWHKYKIYSM